MLQLLLLITLFQSFRQFILFKFTHPSSIEADTILLHLR